MIVGTAGHIDHGKTALVRALTGIDTDRLKEEKARGISIELGYAYQPIDPHDPDGVRIGFVDMPGHERFIATMLAGASGIEFGLLVVAADDGVMPQTREHLQILQLLGMRDGVIVISKCDLVDAGRREEVGNEIAKLVAPTFLADAARFEVSTVTGVGIDALRAHLFAAAQAAHQKEIGNTRTDAKATDNLPHCGAVEHFRLAVDRSFSIDGRGTVVTGTVHAGRLSVGSSVRILPSASGGAMAVARLRGMHALQRPVDTCHRGERVSLNLVGLQKSDIVRGDWVVAEAVAHRVERPAVALSLLAHARALQHWSSVHVHVGAAHTTAHVALLEADRLAPGASMLAELVLDVPLHLCHGDRIILRDASAQHTIGGAVVRDVFSPMRGKRSARRLALLRAEAEPDAARALQALLAIETHGLDLTQFAANRNLDRAVLPALLADTDAVSFNTPDAMIACARAHWQKLRETVLSTLATLHLREPDDAGVERERLRRQSLPTLAAPLFTQLLQGLLDEQLVQVTQQLFIALPSHRVSLNDAEQAQWQQLSHLLAQTPLQPPRVRPLAATLQVSEEVVRATLAKAARLGLCTRVAHDHFYSRAAVDQLASHVRALCDEYGEATVAPFRDRIGTGRKLAVEILEFFDRAGFTRRIQDRHLMRQGAMWHG